MVIGLAVLLPGCGTAHHAIGKEPVATRPPSSAVGRSTPFKPSPREAALEAYRAMWHDFVRAARTSNASDPLLSRHASGAALRLIRSGLRSDHGKGIVTRGYLRLRPTVVWARPAKDPRSVRVRDCADASHWLTYTRSGHRPPGGTAGRHRVAALVDRAGGRWTVSSFFVEATGTCS